MTGDKIETVEMLRGEVFWCGAAGDPATWRATGPIHYRPNDAVSQTTTLSGAIDQAIADERFRLRAALQDMKPSETPFSRGSYELERKAEMRLWEKMMRAVGE